MKYLFSLSLVLAALVVGFLAGRYYQAHWAAPGPVAGDGEPGQVVPWAFPPAPSGVPSPWETPLPGPESGLPPLPVGPPGTPPFLPPTPGITPPAALPFFAGDPEGLMRQTLNPANPYLEEYFSPFELAPHELPLEEFKQQLRESLKDAGLSAEALEAQVETLAKTLRGETYLPAQAPMPVLPGAPAVKQP